MQVQAFAGGIGGVSRLILNWSPLGLFYKAFAGVMKWFNIDLPGQFTEFGGHLIDGLVNGIKNKWESLKSTVTEMGDSVGGWFKEKLDKILTRDMLIEASSELAGAFVPLFFGAFWSRANTQGALFAIFGGVGSWLLIELFIGEASLVPPQLIGLLVSMFAMVIGSLLPHWVGKPTPQEDIHEQLHHRAAAETHHVAERRPGH